MVIRTSQYTEEVCSGFGVSLRICPGKFIFPIKIRLSHSFIIFYLKKKDDEFWIIQYFIAFFVNFLVFHVLND